MVNEEANYAVSVGARPREDVECSSGLIFFDLTDPSNPTKMGCNGDDGYVHDVRAPGYSQLTCLYDCKLALLTGRLFSKAHCLIYRGPHEKYYGRDICYGYNEDTLTIYDVTNKLNSSIISITSYEGATYTHQGWTLDTQWQEYLFMDDE